MNVRDAFYEVLRAHGITTIFGNPGSNELPLLRDFPGDFRYILALHEGAAIGMADGFAQVTGRPALVNLHAAAGTGNAMGNLTNTQSGHVPVIVTSGQQARRYLALNAMLTSVDAPKLVEPLVKWSNEPARPQDVPQALSKGILLASAAPAGPVYISLPLDDWDQEADVSALGHLTSRVVDGDPVVSDQSLSRLRDRLASAANPVMVAGPGIDTEAGWDGAVRLAEKLAMPVLVAPSPSRCPFPTRHPSFHGILPASIPGVASHLTDHDVVVAFGGAIFRYHEFIEGDYLSEKTELWAWPGLGPARRDRPSARRPLQARAGDPRRWGGALHRERPMDCCAVQDPGCLRRRPEFRVRRAEGFHPPDARAEHTRARVTRHGHHRDRDVLRHRVHARALPVGPHRRRQAGTRVGPSAPYRGHRAALRRPLRQARLS
jgi:hypothetical protein